MYKPSSIPFAKKFAALNHNGNGECGNGDNSTNNTFALVLKQRRISNSLFFGFILSCVVMLVSTTLSASVQAQTKPPSADKSTIATDFLLPVTAKSKNQSVDGKTRTSIFIDNVVIRQGSLEILADKVIADATAGKGKEIITAIGRPASYKQRLEDGTVVSASANEIKYQVQSQTISLKGNAAIKQNDIKVNGDSIAFNMAKEQIIASSDKNSNESVTTVLSPGAFVSDKENDEDKP
jgi:lipopolysaccharide export system protein LptA